MQEAEGKKCQHSEVNGQDAVGAAKIKSLEISRRVPDVPENPADKESREHEKQIHTAPTKSPENREAGEKVRRKMLVEASVKEQDQQNGDSAQPIQFRKAGRGPNRRRRERFHQRHFRRWERAWV